MASPRFTLLAFAIFLIAFVAILWAARGFPALTEHAPIAGAAR